MKKVKEFKLFVYTLLTLFLFMLAVGCSTQKRCEKYTAKAKQLGCLTSHDSTYEKITYKDKIVKVRGPIITLTDTIRAICKDSSFPVFINTNKTTSNGSSIQFTSIDTNGILTINTDCGETIVNLRDSLREKISYINTLETEYIKAEKKGLSNWKLFKIYISIAFIFFIIGYLIKMFQPFIVGIIKKVLI